MWKFSKAFSPIYPNSPSEVFLFCERRCPATREILQNFECNYYSPPLKYTARIFSWVKRAVKALLKLHKTYIFTKKCKKFSWLNDDKNPPRTDCSKKYRNTELYVASKSYKHPDFYIFWSTFLLLNLFDILVISLSYINQ